MMNRDSVLSPSQRRTTEIQDPYVMDDQTRSKLAGQQLEAISRDVHKSAKTVMKRSIVGPKVVDLTNDPLALGIRPSTAI